MQVQVRAIERRMDVCVRAVRAQELPYKFVTKRPTRLTDPMTVDYDEQQREKERNENNDDVNVYAYASSSSMMTQQDRRSIDQLKLEVERRKIEAAEHESIARVRVFCKTLPNMYTGYQRSERNHDGFGVFSPRTGRSGGQYRSECRQSTTTRRGRRQTGELPVMYTRQLTCAGPTCRRLQHGQVPVGWCGRGRGVGWRPCRHCRRTVERRGGGRGWRGCW